ncbi:sodium:solute symporter [Salmonella enterica subsp. enterica serovar Hvittingfoss]|nr:sodium:solute symporter [Salmonella enterica subsp. enterica serovar Hvittingfoss]EHL2849279.1 sodium:solute symporter [Salmonella enterica subsp. enterica serovar Hvittingfoss]
MKKVFELVMFTLFFSSLAGFGFTSGVLCYLGVAQLISEKLL